MLVNVVFNRVPSPVMTGMMATAIPVAIRPYSMAVAARSSRKKARIVRTPRSPLLHLGRCRRRGRSGVVLGRRRQHGPGGKQEPAEEDVPGGIGLIEARNR